jgi:lambda repressor-like predicted transcriptional regulator
MADVEKNKRLSAADREKLGARLEKAYAKGRSIAALAEENGTSAGRVRLILLERGVVLRARGGNTRKPDPERSKRAKTLAAEYRDGASLAQLGATHGVSATTARNLVLAGGGDLRARGGRKAAAS